MKSITAYILAGGKSSRMGTDKGLLLLNGKPFVSHIYDALKPIVGDAIVIVSANADYDFLGCERIEDVIPDKGPVGGIYTALHHSKSDFNIIVSTDVPMISTELLQWIIENNINEYQLTQIAVDGKSSPLIGVYNKSLETVFKANLATEQLRLRKVIESIKHQTLELPEEWHFQAQNINTKEEYQNIVQ